MQQVSKKKKKKKKKKKDLTNRMDEKKISNLKIFPTSAGDERKQNQRTGTHFFFFTLIWTAFICLCVYLVGGVIVFSKIRSVSGRPNNRRSYYHVKYYKYCIGWDLFFFCFVFSFVYRSNSQI